MQVDLLTLYLLAVGTLFATAGMTFWEHRTNVRRSRPLRILAAGFAILAIGCAAALVRRQLPHGIGSALANLVILAGYLLILGGIAALGGRRYRGVSVAVLVVMALIWAVAGAAGENLVWNYVSALAIALISGLSAWEMHRCASMRSLPARYIVVAMAGIHTVFYLGRGLVLPWAVDVYGQSLLAAAGKITLYEGVLYSVVLPMALLKLVRDEAHGQLLLESQTDFLTRLGNRRSFFEQGAAALENRGQRGPIAILAFDLDRFKSINDVHGHHAGDEVLKRFAEVARRVLGAEAILARIGGEEFAALLSGEDAHDAAARGQAVTRAFADSTHDPRAGLNIAATVSVGLAVYPDEVPALSDGLAAADRALYRAKALGGNQLAMA
jgi:diguanylate cyclase (GGDEF)-like protein